jgi:tRNA threonylcarbamoyladenosine modification (KEOPS) complex  Pcc1 subunit
MVRLIINADVLEVIADDACALRAANKGYWRAVDWADSADPPHAS